MSTTRELTDALIFWIDNYDPRGKTYRQFHADLAAAHPVLDKMITDRVNDQELWDGYNFAMAGADADGFYPHSFHLTLDNLIVRGKATRQELDVMLDLLRKQVPEISDYYAAPESGEIFDDDARTIEAEVAPDDMAYFREQVAAIRATLPNGGDLTPREKLDKELDRLQGDMPLLIQNVREEDRLEAFAAVADPIRESAAPGDEAHVWSRLQCMLRDNGLIPGDDEPCDPS